MEDLELENAIHAEEVRQSHNIELIASENFVSKEVREAAGSVLTNKYAEGYPGHRYYGGCANVDVVENLARDRACRLFGADHANVQPHSGSQANMAAYFSLLKTGDTILGMDLAAGGHLTHGAKVSFSGKFFNSVSYGVDRETERIDYDAVRKIANEVHPQMIVAGASAYAREIDFAEFRRIADECGAYLMVDMAHIAGLVAAGYHMNPVPYADIVTTTTHKTLRGPRGGMILCREQYAKALGGALEEEGMRLVTGGTDNHLVLVDVLNSIGVTGVEAEKALDEVNITVNKNAIPFDTTKPTVDSGIRLGSAAMTTKGYSADDFRTIGHWIGTVLKNKDNAGVKSKVKEQVLAMTAAHPFE